MLFWTAAAALTLLASLAVLLPLSRRQRVDGAKGDTGHSHDLAVYRDQLAELERDAARGLIGQAEAEEARAEVGRRILKAASAAGNTIPAGGRAWAKMFATAAVLSVPLVSWGIYAAIGSPEQPGQPLAARLAKNPAEASVQELVARAEAHLAANPEDGRGWDVLAPIYLRLGRSQEAVTAYENVIRIEGTTAQREAGLGEAIASFNRGTVTAEAEAAFRRALEQMPEEPKSSFYLAVAEFQEGRVAEAVAAWQTLADRSAPDSPWREAALQAIAAAGAASAAPLPGPSTADIEAAEQMAPEDRQAMVETMVASLDQRLRQNPRDPEGWTRLIRSYVVLGRRDDARDALIRAQAALIPGSEDAIVVTRAAGEIGISATE